MRWLFACLGLLLVSWVLAVPASAHAELESSDPPDGAHLKLAPKQVTLVFGEDLLPGGTAVTATNKDTSQRLDLAAPQLSGDTVRVTWPTQAVGGDYQVAFRVVSADGHPITGRIAFTYDQARVTASDVQPSASAAASGADQSHPAEALGPTPEKDPVSSPVLAAALGVGVVALGAMGFGFWYTTRRQ